MAKYRKKPVMVEAEQFDGTWECAERLSLAYCSNVFPELSNDGEYQGRLKVATLEGVMIAEPGDYIITGVKGERYPCKPDIFEATYEAAD